MNVFYDLEDITDSYDLGWTLGGDGKFHPPHGNPDAKPDHVNCRCVVPSPIEVKP